MTEPNQTEWTPHYADRMSGMQASEIRELLKVAARPDVISFAGGIPDPALFPREHIQQAYDKILSDADAASKALQYSVSEGDLGLRTWIAGHMQRGGVDCGPEHILITNGSQQALEFIGKLFISPKDTVLVEAPTYLGALQAFSPNQPHYDALGLGQSNRTAGSYQQAASAAEGRPSFAYVVPDFANPTGRTLDKPARLQLLALADELDMPIVEDSPYAALRFEGAPEPSILSLDLARTGSIERSKVLHCGSFSKVFTPGLRVGWVCAATEIIARLCLIKQACDLNSPAINQMVMLELAQTAYTEQVEKAVKSYRVKRDAMLAALKTHMPESAKWTQPEGGMFIWLELAEGMDTAALLPEIIERSGVAYVPGHAFFADKRGHNTLRLSYSLPALADIEPTIAKLAAHFKG